METLEAAIAESNIKWKEAHIAEVLAIMEEHGISIADLEEEQTQVSRNSHGRPTQ